MRTGLALALFFLASPAFAQDEAAAEALLTERGCVACHSLDGTARVGPSFAGAASHPHRVTSAGASREVAFDAAYVELSIRSPDEDLAEGYGPGTMPRYLAVDDADAHALTAAVLVLSTRVPPAPPSTRSPLFLLVAVLAFVLGHFVLSSSPIRAGLVRAVGEGPFGAVYSVLILAAFAWMVAEWVWAPFVEVWRPPGWTRWVPNVVMPVSYTLLVAGFTSKSPTIAGMASAAAGGPTGWPRITRHPALWGFALWGLSHLAANGDLRSVLLMGGVTTLALGGMLHIDARRRASGGADWAAFERATSVVPFAAIMRGNARPTLAELGWWRIALGIGGWAAMLAIHRWLIGVSPMP